MGSLFGGEAPHRIDPERAGQLHDQQWVGAPLLEGDQVALQDGRKIGQPYACEVGRELARLFRNRTKLRIPDDPADDLVQG
ncbi:hypothetical protein A5731_25675 [Mycolicibacterium conceptionense]|jgi:hypothetical protein|uniref:Uncharacterized protein n=1 Tax=Mycolicibacterium conceptionense TaxID=451644 RepID=A0A1A1ZAT3_9MYCO|nr:hypothetical protein A5718_08190 [Mycolicibacterium conceptionense]OCW85717.1 hypothetical protein A8M60_04425 [Nocardia farcinica]OBE95723.1 hypothetical protein A5731_25675 [Mycolicibacterium conceptionense]OBF28089.1 hypothetical protein A5726_03530 [Mycolicibacterium conceptionense]OBF40685.1 hypothetical protein A5720_16120 [Mycolicibacterium conceptionense]